MTRRSMPTRTFIIVHLSSSNVDTPDSPIVHAQDSATPRSDFLMDKMSGEWVMTGTIDEKEVTHDVHVDLVEIAQYLRIHEVSREKDCSRTAGIRSVDTHRMGQRKC